MNPYRALRLFAGRAGSTGQPLSNAPAAVSVRTAIALFGSLLLGALNLELTCHIPLHQLWLPGGLGLALALLWGPSTLLATAAGAVLTAWWCTGDALTGLSFGLQQLLACGAAWWVAARCRLGLRLQTLADVGVLAGPCAVVYAVVSVLASMAAPKDFDALQSPARCATWHARAVGSPADDKPDASAIGLVDAEAYRQVNLTVHVPTHEAAHPLIAAHTLAVAHGLPSDAFAAASPEQPARTTLLERLLLGMLVVLLVTPVVLRVFHGPEPVSTSDASKAHAWLMLALLLAITASIYSGFLERVLGVRHAPLLMMPPGIWLALCFPLTFTLLGNILAVLMVEVGTSLGYGPFADHTFGLALLNVVYVSTSLLVGASRSERLQAEHKLREMATHDPLTNLANRSALAMRLDSAVCAAGGSGQKLAVMFIDLDRFKQINDSLGHDVGDQLLIQASRRIQAALDGNALAARTGGDEFVILIEQIEGAEIASTAASRIVRALSEPFEVQQHRLAVSGSVGIAIFPDDGEIASELLKHADSAMYQAKASGGSRFHHFGQAGDIRVG